VNAELAVSRHQLKITQEAAERTLADTVRRMLPETSWNQARELCRRGKVRRNGAIARDSALRVQCDDEIEIDLHAPRIREHVLPESAIVHLDPDVVVVDKPAGVLSVPYENGDKNTLIDRVRFLLRRMQADHRASAELGAVQRLDKDTSGLIVFARTLAAKRHLQELLRSHSIERRYLAIAHGAVSACRSESQFVTNRGDGLRGSWGRFRRASGPIPRDAQRALTFIEPLLPLSAATLVECRLETGRQHQIRIHLSELGHPLVGERVYVRDFRGTFIEAPRPMLHAETLGFTHPRTGQELRFSQPPPEDFEHCLAALRGD
jgi:23S rRNA pseudouridine1911/1915/1917 synthase